MGETINLSATIGDCPSFTNEQGKQGQVSVVIAPIKVTNDPKTGKTSIINGCSMWRSCFNTNCWYSFGSRANSKKTG